MPNFVIFGSRMRFYSTVLVNFVRQQVEVNLTNKFAPITANYCSKSTNESRLMEFFDDKKNWGESEIKSGRSWRKEELRLKSNGDLHKLWYVLLKERNMLLTMENECNRLVRAFPSPERIDKVSESMENLEEVVRERNRAYHLLETGVDGERSVVETTDPFGIPITKKLEEYAIPKEMNEEWQEKNQRYDDTKEGKQFLLKYKEKLSRQKAQEKTRNFNHVMGLLKRFPNMDLEAVKEQYPDVDIEKAKANKKSRGHFPPE